jgi:hypothetical protein
MKIKTFNSTLYIFFVFSCLVGCRSCLMNEKDYVRSTKNLYFPEELKHSNIVISLVDSIDPKGILGTDSYSKMKFDTPFIPEEISQTKKLANERSIIKQYNEYVPYMNKNIFSNIRKFNIKCTTIRRKDYYGLDSTLNQKNCRYLLVRIPKYLYNFQAFTYEYYLFDRFLQTSKELNFAFRYNVNIISWTEDHLMRKLGEFQNAK